MRDGERLAACKPRRRAVLSDERPRGCGVRLAFRLGFRLAFTAPVRDEAEGRHRERDFGGSAAPTSPPSRGGEA